ncbi:MAG TPA: hypothetical protein VLZ83_13495 [Edaphocola sp.]|nr:hypothetical protein [Edaphocola sp.]
MCFNYLNKVTDEAPVCIDLSKIPTWNKYKHHQGSIYENYFISNYFKFQFIYKDDYIDVYFNDYHETEKIGHLKLEERIELEAIKK